jgi:hypothetical protein
MSVQLYGASDDLIEFTGDIYDEVSPDDESEWTFVAFDNGLLAKIVYNGEWTIKVVHAPVDVKWEIQTVGHVDAEEFNDYTDVLTIHSDVYGAVVGVKV